ncbi:MAG: hypothetical protein ABWY00_11105 [Dongiaceae bacterium]
MRILDIHETTVPIPRYADPALPRGGLFFRPLWPRGLDPGAFRTAIAAGACSPALAPDGDNLDPARAWAVMMQGEKPGGHGERCVAIGTLDMAIWDGARLADGSIVLGVQPGIGLEAQSALMELIGGILG